MNAIVKYSKKWMRVIGIGLMAIFKEKSFILKQEY